MSKRFCEEEQDSIDVQPRIENPCCACQEAKYEVTFEGLWSRHTHPKDFPSNRWLTRFSDIIGASHSIDYRFWEYGQPASEGLQQVAEHGSTRMLESELKSQSDHIRTIIKARGISYPNVTGKTFAVFRVDSTHHLVSLVSMIDPSPDWIVGVSGLELCLPNCTWMEQKTLNLYPWDAGTDSGITYTSPNEATHPKDVVRRVKASDPRSPFYDSNGPDMKAMARIYFTRQRLYDKNCEEESSDDQRCATGPWTAYEQCSESCGKGYRYLHREYLDKISATHICTKELTRRVECEGTQCHDPGRNDEVNEVDPECSLTPWSQWSKCSKHCGRGTKMQSRRFKNPGSAKKCQAAFPNELLQQSIPCNGQECGGDITEATESPYETRAGGNGNGNHHSCKWSAWTNWSPCNTNCGSGKQMRYRYPLHRDLDFYAVQQRAITVFSKATSNMGDDPMDNSMSNLVEHELMRGDCGELFCFPYSDVCANEEFWETIECPNQPSCKDIPHYCFIDPSPGSCRDAVNRWYFDRRQNGCGLFSYGGCHGNQNKFMSLADCETVCKPGVQTPDRNNTFDPMSSMLILNQRRLDQTVGGRNTQDCVFTSWERGPCNVSCGEGMRKKERKIIRRAENGGKRCPRILIKYESCNVPCDRFNSHGGGGVGSSNGCQYTKWSPWSPCSHTCGEYSVQTRERFLINPSYNHQCRDRVEERRCNVMPCGYL